MTHLKKASGRELKKNRVRREIMAGAKGNKGRQAFLSLGAECKRKENGVYGST